MQTSVGLAVNLCPPIGTMVMLSVPPATMTSAPPPRMRSAAKAIACKAGCAEPVNRHSRAFNRQSGPQGGDAGNVHALLGFGHGAAQDHVFDLAHIELRHALKRALDGDGAEIVRPRRPQGSFVSLADRRPDGGYDDYFTHDLVPQGLAGLQV